MTLLVAWAAIDTHGPSSIYIASDSRITWGSSATFDRGRKIFAFKNSPDILGYCGDVLFPSVALNQIVELADAGLLFGPSFTGEQKFQAIVDKLNDLVAEYPQLHSSLATNALTVVHASRGAHSKQAFSCNTITWRTRQGWSGKAAALPAKSDVLFALGSASDSFNANYVRYRAGPTSGTSRAVVHCFCDTLASGNDMTIGGPPQLVGIIRKPGSNAITFGVLHAGRRTYLGAHIDNLRNFQAVQWRNSNFELCDGRTGEKLAIAQRQPDPNRRL